MFEAFNIEDSRKNQVACLNTCILIVMVAELVNKSIDDTLLI